MRSFTFAASSLLAGLAVALPAAGQTTADDRAWRMPYQSGFWGHAGISAGRSELDVDCPSGISCDTKDTLLRAYAGGRFNNALGLEAGLIDFGEWDIAGGKADAWGLDLALVAGFPIGANSAVFGKVGGIYAETDTPLGDEDGLGARFGIGAQIGLTTNLALRADLDRYKLDFVGGEEDVDSLTLGLQYTFR